MVRRMWESNGIAQQLSSNISVTAPEKLCLTFRFLTVWGWSVCESPKLGDDEIRTSQQAVSHHNFRDSRSLIFSSCTKLSTRATYKR
jgi:hypothetical protein